MPKAVDVGAQELSCCALARHRAFAASTPYARRGAKVIGAGSVVTRDIPSFVFGACIPAA
jgi:hypothetical protein